MGHLDRKKNLEQGSFQTKCILTCWESDSQNRKFFLSKQFKSVVNMEYHHEISCSIIFQFRIKCSSKCHRCFFGNNTVTILKLMSNFYNELFEGKMKQKYDKICFIFQSHRWCHPEIGFIDVIQESFHIFSDKWNVFQWQIYNSSE